MLERAQSKLKKNVNEKNISLPSFFANKIFFICQQLVALKRGQEEMIGPI